MPHYQAGDHASPRRRSPTQSRIRSRNRVQNRSPSGIAARTVRTAGLSLAVLMCVPRAPLQAQSGAAGSPAGATVHLARGHPAYETLFRLAGAGLLPDLDTSRRPLARRTAARALLAGARAARSGGLGALAAEAEWRLREFSRDLPPGEAAAGTAVEPAAALIRIRWEGEHDTRFTGEPTVELGFDTRTDLPPDHTGAATARWGFELYGTAGPAVGWAARYRESVEDRRGSIKRWPYAPEQTVPHDLVGFGGRQSYSESSGHLSFDGPVLGFDLCLDSPVWGPSPGSNLLFSGHAPAFGHLQLRVKLGDWLHYTMMTGTLNSGVFDSLGSYEQAGVGIFRPLYRSKYVIGHRLDFHLLPRFRFGLNEVVVVGDRFPEFVYLVPTASVWDVQHLVTDVDNALMAVDAVWSPRRGPYLYGGILIDEWLLPQTFSSTEAHNWVAFQAGAVWTPSFLDGRLNLRLEATRVLPNTYRHQYEVNDWTHAGYGLGFWSGQNSEVIEARLTWLANPRLIVTCWGRTARKGGEVSRLEQYTTPPSEKFLFGEVRRGTWTGIMAAYEGDRHWRLIAEAVLAPAGLWPHEAPPSSAGREGQIFLRWCYNPF